MAKPDAVIFDRDGTLASVAYVRPSQIEKGRLYTKAERDAIKAEWAQFNAALPFDAPIPAVVEMTKTLADHVVRIVVSGRMEGDYPGDRHRQLQMEDWIVKHHLTVDFLFMREGGDLRPDSVVKEEMYHKYIEPFFNVLYVVDDRPVVISMWKRLGLKVIEVTDPGILPPIGE
jgi:hypothetical protein